MRGSLDNGERGAGAIACVLLLAGAMFIAGPASGQTHPAATSSATAGAQAKVGELIRQLGSDDYKVRQNAQAQLRKLGSAARAALEKAAAGDDSEVRQRAADLLKEIAQVEFEANARRVRKGILWTFEVNGGAAGEPVAADGKVIFLGSDRLLHAIDVAGGKEVWRLGTFTIKVGDCDQPQVSDGAVFLTDRVDSVYGVDLAKGQLLWRSTAWTGPGRPCVGGGTMYIGDGGPGLHALAAGTGKEKWKLECKDYGIRPALSGGMLFVVNGIEKGGDDAEGDRPSSRVPVISALAAETTKLIWQFDPEALCTHLAVAGDTLYFKAGAIVSALEARTGKRLWRFELPALVREEGLLAVVDGAVYATCYDQLFALDAKTGEKKWMADFPPADAQTPKDQAVRGMMGLAVDASGVYVGRCDGLHALDLQTGKETWVLRTANKLNVGPVAAGGVIFFGTTREANPAGGDKKDFDDSPGLHALRVK